MIWTMILVTSMYSGYNQGGDAISSLSITGFSSKKACVDAGMLIELPRSTEHHPINSTFTCVPMG